MFISQVIFEWQYYYDNGSGLSTDDEETLVWRAHDIWRHALSLVTSDSSDFVRSDAVANLKRAVNHRLQTLSRVYSFDALPFLNRKQTLEKFQYYGIIRPALLKEIFEIRNAIEHKDDSPPSVADCKRYCDFVWYFLKSTDSLFLMRPDEVIFWSDKEKNSLVFKPKFDEAWTITVHGKIDPQYILASNLPGSIEIDESLEKPSYIHTPIYGKWNPSPDQLTDFARKYFGLAGYWWDDYT